MNVRGGRVGLRLCVAGALALLILPIFPVAPAQGVADPWWGPVDRANPTSGWAVRIPIVVENKYDFALERPFVAAEIDFSAALVKAGWTNTSRDGVTRSRGFELDVDSIRVVQYTGGFTGGPIDGATTKPTPHLFYKSLFEGKHRNFDPTAAAGTVLFQVNADFFPPQAKRYYYVYANPVEYGDIPPPAFDALEMGALDSFMWGTRGNTYLGFEPQSEGQTDHYTLIRAVAPGTTTVTLSVLGAGGTFTPLASTSGQPNPMFMTGGFQKVTLPTGRPFKIAADKPIVVAGAGGASFGESVSEHVGYLPGVSGSFADTTFDVYGWSFASNIGSGSASLKIIKACPPGSLGCAGTVTVTSSANGQTGTLTSASPVGNILVPLNQWTRITGNGKFLVSLHREEQGTQEPEVAFPLYQVPSTSGGPSGIQFYNQLVTTEGFVRVCPEANATIRIVHSSTNSQIDPEGIASNTPPRLFTKQDFCEEIEVPRHAPMGKYEMYSTKEQVDPVPGAPVPFRMFVGSGERNSDPTMNWTRPMVGHFGGVGGVDYYTYGPTGLFGHYNDTSVTILEEKVKNGATTLAKSSRSLQRDGYLAILRSADGTGRFHITSTKPISAVSLEPAIYTQTEGTSNNAEIVTMNAPYVRHVPGRPMLPSTTIGDLEFRGPLVDLMAPANPGSRVLPVTTGPGSPVEARVDVLNLGRWLSGARLEDTIVVSCSGPVGWTVEGCNREVRLNGGSAERLNVVVTPTQDDVGQTLPIVLEARSKAGGAVATFTIRVTVEIRYGVGLWFDVEGGRKTMDPPVGLSPGETYRGTVVMKNTGSTEDRFTLRLEEPADGWEHELLFDGEPIREVTLGGEETVLLEYRSKAPNTEQGAQNLVSISAQSESSRLAGDIIFPGTRIRPKIDLEMALAPTTQLAAPNETVTFNVTTRNKGNDVFTILFRQDSILPVGWNATMSTAEVSLNPNDTYVMQLRVTPVEGARAGDLASVKLTAEVDTGAGRAAGDEVSAVVVVRRVYNLTTPPLFDAEALPGDSFVYTLPIMNVGNGQVDVELLSTSADAELLLANGDAEPVADWRVSMQDPEVLLTLNETVDVPLRIEVPPLTRPGTYNVTFTTRLSREAVQNLTVPVQVAALSRVEMEGPSRVEVTPGRPVQAAFVARNTGNIEGEYDLTARAPEGWNATFTPARARLAPGERVDVRMTLNASRETANGPYEVDIASVTEGHAATERAIDVAVARPQLYLADATATGDLQTGELVLVTATIGNRGGITADNVSIALTVDGRVVDRVLIARIPVGTTQVATLSWVATQRGGDVAVVLDPEQEIELQTRDETQKGIAFGSRVGVPGPAAWLVLAAVAIALLGRRR